VSETPISQPAHTIVHVYIGTGTGAEVYKG
jgi:hypothetical protein